MLTAFGKHDLGLPIKGLNENKNKLNVNDMQNFINENFSLDKIYIFGGSNNHEDFCSLVD